MSREAQLAAPSPRKSKRAEIEVANVDDVALVRVQGMLDEHFPSFGELSANIVVLDVSGIRFITSFGVRQWLRAMAALPANAHIYLAGCPQIFVDQLNMILNFGGRAQILTLRAPYRCPACGTESDETIDLVKEGTVIANGRTPERACKKCNAQLVLDEMPETYFACLGKHAPRDVDPRAVQVLAAAPAKHVVKPNVPRRTPAAAVVATAQPVRTKSSIVSWIVIAIMLAILVTGLYVLVGPS
jgi:hypothetical protein